MNDVAIDSEIVYLASPLFYFRAKSDWFMPNSVASESMASQINGRFQFGVRFEPVTVSFFIENKKKIRIVKLLFSI